VSQRVGDTLRSNRVNALVFDSENALWCATDQGIYRRDARSLHFEAVLPMEPADSMMQALADREGRLWFGIMDLLVERTSGQWIRYEREEVVASSTLRALVEDHDGRILAANHFGVFELIPPADPGERGQWKRIPIALAPGQEIRSMTVSAAGVLWVGTTRGLIKYAEGRQTLYTGTHGLRDDFVWAVMEDREGNLWIGTNDGVSLLRTDAIVSYTVADGLPDAAKILEGPDGVIYVRTSRGGVAQIVDGKATLVPGSQYPPFNPLRVNFVPVDILRDSRGDFWVGAGTEFFRFRGPRLQFRGGKKFGPADGIAEGTCFCGASQGIREDALGRIWVSTCGRLYWIDPSGEEPHRFQSISTGEFLVPYVLAIDRTCLSVRTSAARCSSSSKSAFTTVHAIRAALEWRSTFDSTEVGSLYR